MTSKKRVMLVIGVRPQIIKAAPLIRTLKKATDFQLQLVHTGQHYDFAMSKIFFNELDLPDPLVNLGVGSGTQAWQTSETMIGLEKTIMKHKPDVVIVFGDANSTLAGALVAVKLHTPVMHIEAGARSHDLSMPEEVNRRLTDHCSSFLLTPTKNCTNNLLKENFVLKQIFQVGDIMYDAMQKHLPKANDEKIVEKLNLDPETYAVLTVHRAGNVNDIKKLKNIIFAVTKISDLKIVFPVHPRTKKKLQETKLSKTLEKAQNIITINPVKYHEMLKLIYNSKMILTDSGGLQKEAFWLHVPCVTLRENTEWIETVELGANVLVGNKPSIILKTVNDYINKTDFKNKLKGFPNPFWNGKVSVKITDILLKELN